MGRLRFPAGLLVVGALLAGCATQSDMEGVHRDLEEMKGRVLQQEKELRDVRTVAQDGVQKQLDGLQRAQADLQASLESTRSDLQVAVSKFDDLRLTVGKPADDLALLREELDKRLSGLEARLDKLEKGLAQQATQAQAAEKTPEGLYQKGLEAFRANDFAGARQQFAKFLESYPQHDLAANAQYWTGETYMGEKNYEQAILAFQEVLKTHPSKEKAAAALYKQGIAFRELGDLKSARYALKKVLEDYPTSEEAKRAEAKLKEF